MSHLDRRLEAERTAAFRASVALARLPDVRDARLEVAPLLDAAQVPAGPVRAGDELTRAERLVGDDLSLEADRAERARVRAERGADLFLGRRAKIGAQRGREFRRLEPVVAAHEREDDGAVRNDGHRLRGRGRID